MNVLSLFDGISCGQLALQRAGIHYDNYYASEIKPIAIKTTQTNFPNTIQIGDVTQCFYKNGLLCTQNGNFKVGNIGLLIGGFPCTDFSIARATTKLEIKGLVGDKSKLFYEYLRLLKELGPTWFLLENVKMSLLHRTELDNHLSVNGLEINSSLVSFQKRLRTYWTNIPNVIVPKDKNISFQTFKDTNYNYCCQFKVNKTPSRERMWNNGNSRQLQKLVCANVTYADKVFCLTRKQDRAPNSGLVEFDGFCRYLTRRELELAQTIPIGYTNYLSYNQAQDVLGDGWTVDVITHIFSFLKPLL